jgi:hypothetical protein
MNWIYQASLARLLLDLPGDRSCRMFTRGALLCAPVAVSVAVSRDVPCGSFVGFLQWPCDQLERRSSVATPIRTAGPFAARGTEAGAAAIAPACAVRNHAQRSSRPQLSPSPFSLSRHDWRSVASTLFWLHWRSVRMGVVVRFGPGRPVEAACPVRGPVGRWRRAVGGVPLKTLKKVLTNRAPTWATTRLSRWMLVVAVSTFYQCCRRGSC